MSGKKRKQQTKEGGEKRVNSKEVDTPLYALEAAGKLTNALRAIWGKKRKKYKKKRKGLREIDG